MKGNSMMDLLKDDLISRQAAIDAIRASTSKYTGFMEMEIKKLSTLGGKMTGTGRKLPR